MLSVLVPWSLTLAAVTLLGISLYRAREKRRGLGHTVASVGIYALTIAVVAVTSACLWNVAASALYYARHLPPGRIVTANGANMHIICKGGGSPTVVLEAGFGSDALDWNTVQEKLQKTVRVCSYDRAGYGWSTPVAGPRDASAITKNLHDLLDAAGVSRPLVLVGHSMGGIYVREYAARYPREVVGLVLVDAATPLQEDRLDPDLIAATAKEINLMKWASLLGVGRLMGMCAGSDANSPASMEAEDFCRPQAGATLDQEMASFRASGEEVLRHSNLGRLPVLVLSHDPTRPILPASFGADKRQQFETVWNAMQEDLVRLSSDSRRIIVRRSGHNIQTDQPDILSREIAAFDRRLR